MHAMSIPAIISLAFAIILLGSGFAAAIQGIRRRTEGEHQRGPVSDIQRRR